MYVAKAEKIERSPMIIVFGIIMLLIGVGLMFIGATNVRSLGWQYAVLVFCSGFGTASMATTALITGKGEWLLIDLILPG